MSQRTIYQVLPLPIEKNVTIEVPIKPKIDIKKKTKGEHRIEMPESRQLEDRHSMNMTNIEKLQQLLNIDREN